MANNSFLPDKYEVPASGGNYMRLQKGDNRFRFLSNPIMGTEWWVELPDGKKSPRRIRLGESVPSTEYDEENKPRHFWAMVVWNYADEKVEILEITQKRVQTAITGLFSNPKWGDPRHYDLNINRSGEGFDTVYQVQPEPKEPLTPEIAQAYKEVKINLEALYDGANPFEGSVAASEMDIDDVFENIDKI